MRKRHVCVFIRALGRVFIRFAPRGAAAYSIQNPHQRVTASSPECSRLGGETLGNSNKTNQNPERSEWVAEAGASRFPMNGGAGFPWSIRETKSCPCRAGRALRRVFIRFCPFSHAARRVFILHAQTHVCAFTRALWRVFIRFRPTRRSRVLYSEPAPAGDSQ